MSPILTTLAPGLLEASSRLIDRLVPDPAEREKAKLALLQAEGQLALQEMQTSLSAILAEANSQDPWTSRARPTFLYVIYGVILLCVKGGFAAVGGQHGQRRGRPDSVCPAGSAHSSGAGSATGQDQPGDLAAAVAGGRCFPGRFATSAPRCPPRLPVNPPIGGILASVIPRFTGSASGIYESSP